MPVIFNPTNTDYRLVRDYCSRGIPVEQICAVLDISYHTYYKYFKRESLLGQAELNLKVGNTFVERVLQPDCPPALLIWWTKARMHWHETKVHEIIGSDKDITKIERVIVSEETLDEPENTDA